MWIIARNLSLSSPPTPGHSSPRSRSDVSPNRQPRTSTSFERGSWHFRNPRSQSLDSIGHSQRNITATTATPATPASRTPPTRLRCRLHRLPVYWAISHSALPRAFLLAPTVAMASVPAGIRSAQPTTAATVHSSRFFSTAGTAMIA